MFSDSGDWGVPEDGPYNSYVKQVSGERCGVETKIELCKSMIAGRNSLYSRNKSSSEMY